MKYSEMSPRQIDKLVADKVMGELMCSGEVVPLKMNRGWECLECGARGYNEVLPTEPHEIPDRHIPRYSTLVSAAMSILEKFERWDLAKLGKDHFRCTIGNYNANTIGATLQDVIIRSALKACGVEIE